MSANQDLYDRIGELEAAVEGLIAAGKAVIESWESGDLAAAVRALSSEIDSADETLAEEEDDAPAPLRLPPSQRIDFDDPNGKYYWPFPR